MMRRIAGLLLFASVVFGQTTTTTLEPGSVPVPALYRFFFRHLANLDVEANTLDAQGQSGSDLRDYYQTILSLSDQETASLKQNGANCMTAVKQVDQQAWGIIQQLRAPFPGGYIPPGSVAPPPTNAQLTQLTQTRDDVTNSQIQALQTALGPTTFQKVDDYVKAQLASQVSTAPIVLYPPAPGAPNAVRGNK
jgi:hypothetical protein